VISLIGWGIINGFSLKREFQGRGYRYKNGGSFFGDLGRKAMSPDQSKIVFASPAHGCGDICLTNTDGSDLIRLTDKPEFEGEPSFSADGGRIVFMYERNNGPGEIWIMNSDGTKQTPLTFNHYEDKKSRIYYIDYMPDFTVDNRNVIFQRTIIRKLFGGNISHGTYMINLNSKQIDELTEKDTEFWIYASGSRDGSKMIFKEQYVDRYWIKYRNGNMIKFADDILQPIFTSDGKRIVFTSDAIIPFAYELYVQNMSDYKPKRLTNLGKYISIRAFSLSFDCSKIIFVAKPKGDRERKIYTVNIDGTNLRAIGNNY